MNILKKIRNKVSEFFLWIYVTGENESWLRAEQKREEKEQPDCPHDTRYKAGMSSTNSLWVCMNCGDIEKRDLDFTGGVEE